MDINGMWYPKHQPSLVEKQTKPSGREQDLICVTGFGYSGSGAVLDILSEYDNVTLVHGVDKDSGRKLENTIDSEFDLLRHAGGVFDLEEAFRTNNPFIKDGKIRLFLRLVAFLYDEGASVWNENFLVQTRKFVDSLIQYRCSTRCFGYDFSRHLMAFGTRGADLLWGREGIADLLFLKDITVAEYRAIAREYIHSLLSELTASQHIILD